MTYIKNFRVTKELYGRNMCCRLSRFMFLPTTAGVCRMAESLV